MSSGSKLALRNLGPPATLSTNNLWPARPALTCSRAEASSAGVRWARGFRRRNRPSHPPARGRHGARGGGLEALFTLEDEIATPRVSRDRGHVPSRVETSHVSSLQGLAPVDEPRALGVGHQEEAAVWLAVAQLELRHTRSTCPPASLAGPTYGPTFVYETSRNHRLFSSEAARARTVAAMKAGLRMSPHAPTFFVDYELILSEGTVPRVGFAFRVGEQVLGDENVEVDARLALDCLRPILRHEADRRDDALARLPLHQLLPRLELGVLVYSDPGVDAGSDWKRFLRFVALPRECSPFAGYSGFLVEDLERARLVWRDPHAQLREAWLELGGLEAALRAFCAELQSVVEARPSLVPKSGGRLRASGVPADLPESRRASER